VHFEAVEVSGANQYNVMPLESVTTAVPLIVVIFSAPALATEAGAELAGLLAPAAGALVAGALVAGVELLLLAELAHADSARARAASPAAPSIFRISNSPLNRALGLPWGSRTWPPLSSTGAVIWRLQGFSSPDQGHV
jgi:hypothetical protein